MAIIEYKPLQEEKSIRLLRIVKGCEIDEIRCGLEHTLAGNAGCPYVALSYCWGSEHCRKFQIDVDGCWVEVRENLYSAMKQIRQFDRDVYLWADAICINQDDKREKGHQVKQMGRIYAGAEEVLIWLGDSNKNIEVLLRLIRSVDEKVTADEAMLGQGNWSTLTPNYIEDELSRAGSESCAKLRQGLVELLQRPYFSRVWVLQEVANARGLKIRCGKSICSARTFALMPSLLEVETDESTQAILDMAPHHRKKSWFSEKRDLHFLLGKFADSKATVERDKIYALLDMSKDACDPDVFPPCYEKNLEIVFRDTASFILFGRIIDEVYSFPPFTLKELSGGILQIALKALIWALSTPGITAQLAAMNLVKYLNDGKIKTVKTSDLLRLLAQGHGAEVGQLESVLSHGEPFLSVDFDDQEGVLRIWSKSEQATLRFPRRDGLSERGKTKDAQEQGWIAQEQIDKAMKQVQKAQVQLQHAQEQVHKAQEQVQKAQEQAQEELKRSQEEAEGLRELRRKVQKESEAAREKLSKVQEAVVKTQKEKWEADDIRGRKELKELVVEEEREEILAILNWIQTWREGVLESLNKKRKREEES